MIASFDVKHKINTLHYRILTLIEGGVIKDERSFIIFWLNFTTPMPTQKASMPRKIMTMGW